MFAGFVRPGRHVIVIYDPETKEFYQKNIIVEVRRSEIIVERGKSTKTEDQLDRDHLFAGWWEDSEQNMRQVYAHDINQYQSETGSGMFSFLLAGLQKEQYFDVMSLI